MGADESGEDLVSGENNNANNTMDFTACGDEDGTNFSGQTVLMVRSAEIPSEIQDGEGTLPKGQISAIKGRGLGDGAGVYGIGGDSDGAGVFGVSGVPGRTTPPPLSTVVGCGVAGTGTTKGVFGDCDAGNGVHGNSGKTGTGVLGESAQGTGVCGASDSTQHAGVLGTDVTGPGNIPPDPEGHHACVWGIPTRLDGHGVHGGTGSHPGGIGVIGASTDDVGVIGRSQIPPGSKAFSVSPRFTAIAPLVPQVPLSPLLAWELAAIGVAGFVDAQEPSPALQATRIPTSLTVGVYGQCPFEGEDSSVPGPQYLAGLFSGPVWVTGDFLIWGRKGAAVPHPDGTHRTLYCLESPESWFEDFGEADLVNGRVRVQLDAEFAATVDTDRYHVFLSPYGDSRGLYVQSRDAGGFEVREHGQGARTLRFSYRVVARRKDVRAPRLAKVNVRPAYPEK